MSVIDLFAGPGGWDVAAHRLGLDPLGIEWDDAACATRRAAGLRTLSWDVAGVEDPAEHWSAVTGLIASPPCQGFSSAGKGQGRKDWLTVSRAANLLALGVDAREQLAADCRDHRSMLVVEPLRWALALKPEWLCFEQVPAVLPFWRYCAELLFAAGYWTWTGYLHAEQFGVPQTRKRAFLIASRVGSVAPPAPTHSKYHPRDKARLDDGVLPWVSMAEALGLDDGPEPAPAPPLTVGAGAGSGGGVEVFAGREARHRAALAVRFGNQPNSAVRTVDEPAATIRYGQRMNACDWVFMRPATTVNCDPRISAPGRHDPNESGSQQKGAVRVTVEQAAVLQSFPSDFPWQGTKTKRFEQVGNAVPPGLAQPVLAAAMAAGVLEAAA